jgi:hypothetical protein
MGGTADFYGKYRKKKRKLQQRAGTQFIYDSGGAIYCTIYIRVYMIV